MLSKLGVKVDEVRSGPLKAEPSPFTPTSDDAKHLTEELVKESQTWFVGLVSERRKEVTPSLDDIKTGRIYIGREALQIGLIDAIGDEETAIKWFTDVTQVKAGLKVRDWKPRVQLRAGPVQFIRGCRRRQARARRAFRCRHAGGAPSAEGAAA